MKTAQQILLSKVPYSNSGMQFYEPFLEAMREYAREAVAEHLERAAMEAGIEDRDDFADPIVVDRDSIRNIEIILK